MAGTVTEPQPTAEDVDRGKRVWKYPVATMPRRNAVEMPRGAQIMHFGYTQPQSGDDARVPQLALWALVNPKEPTQTRTFIVDSTGAEVPVDASPIGSCVFGENVWHCVEVWTVEDRVQALEEHVSG
jgi:hypothetical protein